MNIGKFVLGSAIALGASVPMAPPSQAFNMPDVTFGCRVPPGHSSSHVLYMQRGSKIVDLAHFSWAGGNSREMRCQLSAQKFNAAKNNLNLQFITHGKIGNNECVVCMVKSYGDSCNSMGSHYLFTLTQAQGDTSQADEALRRLLLRINTGSNGAMLYDSESRLYINIDEYLNAALESEGAAAVPETTVVETSP